MTTLDIEQPDQLIAWLRATRHIAAAETPALHTLAGGVSSRTVLVQRPTGESWVLKQSLGKLRVAVDWFSDPARIHTEAAALRWLEQLAPPGAVPAFIFEDDDAHVLAMAAVPQPHANWKRLLLDGGLQAEHAAAFGTLLGTIHARAVPHRAALWDAFGAGYFESLRLEPFYAYVAARLPDAAAFLHPLIDETRTTRLTFVHGDYSPKNVLIHADRLVLLDYEVAHVGDPAFDVGFASAHLLSKANHLTAQRAAFAHAVRRFWAAYSAQTAPLAWDGLERRAVRHTLGCLLARVEGRSPVEYLTPDQRTAQRLAVVALIDDPPPTMSALSVAFTAALP